jgi:hypothetical protein
MPRRRSDNPHQETWHVYYGDVHVGTISERAGVPVDVDQWDGRAAFIRASIATEQRGVLIHTVAEFVDDLPQGRRVLTDDLTRLF